MVISDQCIMQINYGDIVLRSVLRNCRYIASAVRNLLRMN